MLRSFLALILFGLALYACSSEPQLTGEDLAKQYCSSCHAYASPSDLDKASWENYILPRMANMMGIYQHPEMRNELLQEDSLVLDKIYPVQAILSDDEWKRIEAFYLNEAPERLNTSKRLVLDNNELPNFELINPKIKLSPPSSTLVQFNNNNEVLIGDAHTQSLVQLNHNFNLLNAAKVGEGAVSITEKDSFYWITVMGNFSPSDKTNGYIMQLPKRQSQSIQIPIKSLNRPVNSVFADLNNDGLEDVIISEFGKWNGQLSIHKNKGDGTFDRGILMKQTGAIRTEVVDLDNNGYLDIVSLFGQGNESMYISYNDGNFSFTNEKIISFPPSYGSSYFQLFDFNDDGKLDIIYCAGDNADFPSIFKPYQGIYIYLNDGNNHFVQDTFLPMAGVYKAVPADFDLDGDYDIAAISFFPDLKHSINEGFILFDNNNGTYETSTFKNSENGRWICMDVKDYDDDGDDDILLGALAFEAPDNKALEQFWIENGPAALVLRNNKN